jgi:predicted TIM-barrel fold metal-dependent hydrolase
MLTRRKLLVSAAAAAAFSLTSACQTTAGAPQMRLYDTHSHFFSNDVAKYPIDTTGAHEGADVLRARILANPSTPENIQRLWAGSGVEGGVGVQYNSAYKTDNSFTMDSSDAYPDKIAAVIILDARKPDTPAKLRELVQRRGVTGLRLTGYPDKEGNYPWLDSEAAQHTWAEADRLGLAMVLMYLPTEPNQNALEHIGGLSARYPHVKIVLDHIGWPAIAGAPDFGITPGHAALRKHRNIYFKLTTITLDNLKTGGVSAPSFLRHVVDTFGSDHVMWGSDYGNTSGEFPDMVSRAVEATSLLTARERRAVLHDTGKAIFARKAMTR